MAVSRLAQLPEHFSSMRNGVQTCLVFEYLYRDAGNYKAFGEIWLIGSLSEKAQAVLIDSLESNEFFVAEQLGVPSLCEQLYKVTGGRSRDDHAWHTFFGFRSELSVPPGVEVWGMTTDLLAAIVAAKKAWKPELSPNFDW